MILYRDWDHNSNVRAFELGPDSISVQFKGGATYLYTSLTPGRLEVAHMAKLAQAGNGLNGYIGSVIKKRYARKVV